VDLWRRVAEDLRVNYRLTAVSQMDAITTGLENRQFDVAIGAITITPERLTRVDFSYLPIAQASRSRSRGEQDPSRQSSSTVRLCGSTSR
jgi:hypothetical protein